MNEWQGISTYDYIVALREQEQPEGGGQQSPQMSQVSSFTGLSSASSFNAFHRGAWCTPPRLFLEDQVFSLSVYFFVFFESCSQRTPKQDYKELYVCDMALEHVFPHEMNKRNLYVLQ